LPTAKVAPGKLTISGHCSHSRKTWWGPAARGGGSGLTMAIATCGGDCAVVAAGGSGVGGTAGGADIAGGAGRGEVAAGGVACSTFGGGAADRFAAASKCSGRSCDGGIVLAGVRSA